MDIDTGSGDFWVLSDQLPIEQTDNHQTFKIIYGDNSGASGNVGTDTVKIGVATVTQQTNGLATHISESFIPTQQKTFFENIAPELAEPVFTADLRPNAVGAYEFGNIDSSKHNGSLTRSPIDNSRGHWEFSTSKFQVGGYAPIDSPNGKAVADIGTNLLLASAAIVNAYYSKVKGAVNDRKWGGFTFPCNSVLPDLEVDVGANYMATVRRSDINYAPIDTVRTKCYGGVQLTPFDIQIYGDILFKSQFVAFNIGNNTLGIAPHL
ncbi:hypothetical protein K3495_g13768 [Podosphaera aphanis]|nr:hypothetical protein K3495_g13768 [Podosphaera aphanis]